tara:strand:- start:107 stop:367 length:261 start_codon:yes stop_codon:yes gene_type:complete
MTEKKNANLVQSKDIAIGERIKVENLSKPIKDFLEETQKEQKELDESMKESFRQRDERKKREREKTESERMQEELEPLPWCPMSDE